MDVLGARMHLGSGFVAEDDQPGARRSPVIVSYFLWRHELGGDPAIVGRNVTVKGIPFTVVGVLEERIDGLHRPVGLWLSLSALATNGPVMSGGVDGQSANSCCIDMVARIADGADVTQARTELQVLHEQFAASTHRRGGLIEVYGTSPIAGPNADLELFGMVATAVGLILVTGVCECRQPAAGARPGARRGRLNYSHPFCRASRAASTRFAAPSLPIASER